MTIYTNSKGQELLETGYYGPNGGIILGRRDGTVGEYMPEYLTETDKIEDTDWPCSDIIRAAQIKSMGLAY